MSYSNCCLIETKLYSHNSILICLCMGTRKLYSVVRYGTLDSLMKSLSCLTLSNAIQCTCVKSWELSQICTVTLGEAVRKCMKEPIHRRRCLSGRALVLEGTCPGWGTCLGGGVCPDTVQGTTQATDASRFLVSSWYSATVPRRDLAFDN